MKSIEGERGRRGERSPWSGREGAARFSFEQVMRLPSAHFVSAIEGNLCSISRCPPAYNRGNAAETFEFAINFFPSTAKLVDGSIQNIQRDTIVKWEVDCAEIDPNELQSMEEKEVRKLGKLCFGVQSKRFHYCGMMISKESMS